MDTIRVNGEPLFYFDDLPESVRPVARETYITGNREIVRQNMEEMRQLPLNRRINDRYHISRHNRSLTHLRELEQSEAGLDRSIRGNLAMFNGRGENYLFSQRRFTLPRA